MANKKTASKKAKKDTKKVKNAEANVDVKDLFLAEAKSSAFTEETISELDGIKVESPYKKKEVEEPVDTPTDEVEVSDAVIDATDIPTDELVDIIMTSAQDDVVKIVDEENETVEEKTVGELLEEVIEQPEKEEVINVPFVQIVGEETNDANEGVATYATTYSTEDIKEEVKNETPQPKKDTIKPKKRSTSREVYGYHWMGMIFDE